MTIREFISKHKAAIDRRISERLDWVPAGASCFCHRSGTGHLHTARRLNNATRAAWIANDEALYLWAREEGVRV